MCGRFAIAMDADEIEAAAVDEGLEVEQFEDRDQWEGRRYNVAPRTRVPVLRGGAANGRVRAQMMQWGVIPHWTKQPAESGAQLKTINARDDTVLSGTGLWASIRGRKRAIVICDGFYEWLTKSPKDKIAHFTKRKGKGGKSRPLVFAALWDRVTYEGQSESLETFTIVTTDSNKQLSFLHDARPINPAI